ncbi:hypothetical protein HYZ06_00655 [Candidatus Daviesbacteria bacterium]|nr:hypothetical protein [Candidatus Daviesbacteria bacterium]
MTERTTLTPVQARITLLSEVFGSHTDRAVAQTLHSSNWTIWMAEEGARDDLHQREEAVMADAQKSATLMEGVDKVLTTTHLSDREQFCVRSRLSFDGRGVKTFAEVGGEFGVTRKRAAQIYEKAIRRLRQSARSRRLVPFLPETLMVDAGEDLVGPEGIEPS